MRFREVLRQVRLLVGCLPLKLRCSQCHSSFSRAFSFSGIWAGLFGLGGGRLRRRVCGLPRKLDNLTWYKMPVKLTRRGRAFYEKVV